MNRGGILAIGPIVALTMISVACEHNNPTNPINSSTADLIAGVDVTTVDIRGSYLGPPSMLMPADTTAAALEAGVQAAGGLAFISLKARRSPRSVDARGNRAGLSATEARQALDTVASRSGVQLVNYYRTLGLIRARLAPGAATALRSSPYVDFVDPAANAVALPEGHPGTGTMAAERWNLAQRAVLSGNPVIPWNASQIQAPAAWSTSTGATAKVMLIFKGLHDLDPLFPSIPGGNCAGFLHACGGAPYSYGTLQFGVMFARDTTFGFVGIAPGVQGNNLYLWNPYFPDYDSTSIGEEIFALDAAIQQGVQVVYIDMPHTNKVPTEGIAIAQAYAARATIVVGMWGAGQYDSVMYPGSWPNVINVSGVTPSGAFATAGTCESFEWTSGSDYGPMVTLAAPVSAYATYGNSFYFDLWYYGGSTHICSPSLAAGHVAAVAALLRDLHPNWTPAQVREALVRTASGGGTRISDYYGYGIVNAAAAVGYAPLSVSITGPTVVKPNQPCGWWANVTGGVPPYSYSWTPFGTQDGNEVVESFSGPGTLRVTVLDATYGQVSQSVNVTVSSGAQRCTT